MPEARTPSQHPEATLYRRHAARVTTRVVFHAVEKEAEIAAIPRLKRRRLRDDLEGQWLADERAAQVDARAVLLALLDPIADVASALESLAAVRLPDLLGKVEVEQLRLTNALGFLDAAEDAVDRFDFGAAGAAVDECEREMWLVGGQLIVAMNRAITQAAVAKEMRSRLQDNVAERRQAKIRTEHARASTDRMALLEAEGQVRHLEAAGYRLAAEILSNQVRPDTATPTKAKIGRDNQLTVVPPQQLETFADVGGLEDVKQQLRETVGAILERPDEAARYRVVHNGVLFYGPPGTGKNMLSRALAGEYGLRYIRFSPSTIASAYLHEAASNLRQLFEFAKAQAPCLLFLDEIDTIASDRGDQPNADHREVVTQLMICLEEYRSVPGLVIAAATNDLDRLDPALREGRFDSKVYLPLPGPEDRAEVLRVHLTRRGDAVDWTAIDLTELARLTNGYNAAALETVVSAAAQTAMKTRGSIDQAIVAKVIADRGGQHRMTLEQEVTWDDVVLDDPTRGRVMEILAVFSEPELAQRVGVKPPAGIILYGPPGTGKTTIAKAIATQVSASFYEMSAAELLSKWAGESEQRVAKLFAKARGNRPAIIFIDEIDALLRRRSGDTSAKWEERVLSQFLRELDGLRGGDGVLLVGATNRVDTVDEAIVGRRLEPVEVGLPDAQGRLKLLQMLCRDMRLAKNVNLREITADTEGLSGADLKRLRDTAGMKALGRVAGAGAAAKARLSVTMADFTAALENQRGQASLADV
jgi:SpoVK/Ycf46/Vps4 family AAA+-type ATPase